MLYYDSGFASGARPRSGTIGVVYHETDASSLCAMWYSLCGVPLYWFWCLVSHVVKLILCAMVLVMLYAACCS